MEEKGGDSRLEKRRSYGEARGQEKKELRVFFGGSICLRHTYGKYGLYRARKWSRLRGREWRKLEWGTKYI